jgi:hypothetical protein
MTTTKPAAELTRGDVIAYRDSTFGAVRTAEVANVFPSVDSTGTPMVTVWVGRHTDPSFPGLVVMPFAMYVPADHVFVP